MRTLLFAAVAIGTCTVPNRLIPKVDDDAPPAREPLSSYPCPQRCVIGFEWCADDAEHGFYVGRTAAAFSAALTRTPERGARNDLEWLRHVTDRCRDDRDNCFVLCSARPQ